MRALALSAVMLITTAVLAAEPKGQSGFICVPDFATGYAIGRSGKWEPVQFDVGGKRYLLRVKNGRWFWTDFGDEPDDHIDLCSPFNEHGFTECENREDEVRFNRNTLRYQAIRSYGYVVSDATVDKERPSTPFYEIGRCSPL